MAKYGKAASKRVESAVRARRRARSRAAPGRKVTSRKQAIAIGLSEARGKRAARCLPRKARGKARARQRARRQPARLRGRPRGRRRARRPGSHRARQPRTHEGVAARQRRFVRGCARDGVSSCVCPLASPSWSRRCASRRSRVGGRPPALQSDTPSAIVAAPRTRATRISASALIWQAPPAAVARADLSTGPEGVFPYSVAEATAATASPARSARPGVVARAASPPSSCADRPTGATLRRSPGTSPSGPETARPSRRSPATRLMWALGFPTAPALPMNIRCDGCPENPMRGTGERRRAATWRCGRWPCRVEDRVPPGHRSGLVVARAGDGDRRLPAGEERTRQRTHFAALVLLGVLLQHGDRKPEQQALYCAGDSPDLGAGEVRTPGNGDTHRDALRTARRAEPAPSPSRRSWMWAPRSEAPAAPRTRSSRR